MQSLRSSHTDEADASSLASAVDQHLQKLADTSTPSSSSDVEILPNKFLNRNPRYILHSVLPLTADFIFKLVMFFFGSVHTQYNFTLGSVVVFL